MAIKVLDWEVILNDSLHYVIIGKIEDSSYDEYNLGVEPYPYVFFMDNTAYPSTSLEEGGGIAPMNWDGSIELGAPKSS